MSFPHLQLLTEMAKRASPDSFYTAAKKMYGADKVKALSWPEIMAVAKEADVLIPAYLRSQKVGRGRFNLIPPDHADTKIASKPQSTAEPKSEPKAEPKGKGIDIEEVKRMVPDLDKETSGDELYWQVTKYQGKISVSWDHTFKRDTRVGAFTHNKRRIESANMLVQRIADKYKSSVAKISIATMKRAQDADDRDDRGNGYSEYEQSIGGGVELKAE